MFTGLIREIAKVINYQNQILELEANYKPNIGDSISVNGVCLTVIRVNKNSFSLEVGSETFKIIPQNKFLDKVHIEPAMRFKDRIEGHIIQGHIDTIGTVSEILDKGQGVEFIINVDKNFIKYIIPKGSISLDGVSLTVNEVFNSKFSITIVPYTIKHTLIKNYKIGTKINIETDMFARYIEHIMKNRLNNLEFSWNDIDNIQGSY